jgi:hypothetical protein
VAHVELDNCDVDGNIGDGIEVDTTNSLSKSVLSARVDLSWFGQEKDY